MKDVVIIGGPNGAGKTTAAHRLLPEGLNIREYVDADAIARGISPLNPEGNAVRAGRLMIQRIRDLARSGERFAFETTCAGRSHLKLLQECREAGYRLMLLFLYLPFAETAVARVTERVARGGHSVPTDVIVRRYHAGLRNMRPFYLAAVNAASIYDNSGSVPALIAERRPDGHFILHRRHGDRFNHRPDAREHPPFS
jgi:predicted ABC-type ATPase